MVVTGATEIFPLFAMAANKLLALICPPGVSDAEFAPHPFSWDGKIVEAAFFASGGLSLKGSPPFRLFVPTFDFPGTLDALKSARRGSGREYRATSEGEGEG